MTEKGRKDFTPAQLREFDGREGRPVYIAFKGKVYNATESGLWKGGMHQGRHSAGNDLTESLASAPHGEEVFSRLHVVGELRQDKPSKSFIQEVERWHLHAMLIHFPIAYSLVASLAALLYVLTGKISLETTSYYMLGLALITSPLTILSGLFTWKVTYRRRKSRIFKRKIKLSAVLVIVLTGCFLWRSLTPEILTGPMSLSHLYLLLMVGLSPLVSMLGHYGGKIVYD